MKNPFSLQQTKKSVFQALKQKTLKAVCLFICMNMCSENMIFAQKNNKSNEKVWKEQKRKKRQQKKGGVLQNPSGFEVYGQEQGGSQIDWQDENMNNDVSQTRDRKTTRRTKNGKKSNQKPASPDDISLNLGGLFEYEKKPSASIEAVEEVADLDFKTQEDNKYFYNQALLKVRAKDFETAIEYLDKCIATDARNKDLLQMRANSYTEMGKLKKALKDYEKAVEIDGNDPILLYNQGITLTKNGKFNDAIEAFAKALQLKPDYLLALQGSASAKTMAGNYQGAIDDYNRALDENSFYIPAFKGRGVAKSMLHRYEEAISDFSYVIEMQPMDGMAYYYRGLAHVSNNQLFRGCGDFDKAYQLNVLQAYYEIKSICR